MMKSLLFSCVYINEENGFDGNKTGLFRDKKKVCANGKICRIYFKVLEEIAIIVFSYT